MPGLSTQRHRTRIVMWTIVVLCGIAALIPVAKFAGTMATVYRLRSLRHGDARNVPYARANLGSNSAAIRSAAASGLGRIGARADAAVPDLLLALDDASPQVAAAAAWALGGIQAPQPGRLQPPDKKVVDALIRALDHPDGEVRRYAAYAISLIGPKAESAVPRLTQRLDDTHMAYMAARALGEMGPAARGAVPKMAALLRSSDNGQRAEAAVALARLQPLPDETIRAIERLQNDEVDFVRNAARKAVQALQPADEPPIR